MAVIGAGPAGLLFSFAAKVMARQRGRELALHLFDKRTAYVRTHRLRMDPAPYRALQAALHDPAFDGFMQFLAEADFRPAVNDLEAQLSTLVAHVGVHKQQLVFGDDDGQTDLAALRARLRPEGGPLCIVGADSVHSTVRRVLAPAPPRKATHQWVARLKLEADALPQALPVVQQLKLSKLIGSIMDYRRHPGGYAEVDLFLSPGEHARIDDLDANPKAPVVLLRTTTLRAPLFGKVVGHLRDDFVPGGTRVTLWSTFKLEHQHCEPMAFAVDHDTAVFLVGDAAVSLPFFRGMACLAKCVHRLADVHAALSDGQPLAEAVAAYRRQAREVADHELDVVAHRARLIQGTREFVRISALLPFPMQTWLLSLPDEAPPPMRLTDGVALNALVALVALAGAAVAPALPTATFAVVYGLVSLVQIAGGLLYRQTRNVDPADLPSAKRLWTLQMLALIATGVVWPVCTGLSSRPSTWIPLLGWFWFGLCFAAGIVAYEALERRWWPRAALDE